MYSNIMSLRRTDKEELKFLNAIVEKAGGLFEVIEECGMSLLILKGTALEYDPDTKLFYFYMPRETLNFIKGYDYRKELKERTNNNLVFNIEELLDFEGSAITPEIKEKILFNLDLFR